MKPSSTVTLSGARRRRTIAVAVWCVVGVSLWMAARLRGPGASQEPAPERASVDLVRRDGVLCDKANLRPFTGWLTEHYPNGAARSRSWLAGGVLQGISEGWHTNGVLEIREHFVAGVSEGQVVRWRDDGSKLSEGEVRAGKLEGLFRRWHPNGQLAEEATLRAGEPHGLSRAWFPNGDLRAEVMLDGGKVISQHFWKAGENEGPTDVAAAVRSP
jgi:antitoxin component YwqK of YwqJK toxin-antitoxin module